MAIDPVKERQRLTDVYSRMTDAEIQELAEDAASLTDVARQVLNEEMASRGLDPVQPDAGEPQDEATLRQMVAIRSFPDVMQAWLARSSLESAGIECCLVDDNMVRLDWGISIILGGVKLQVRPEDAEAAIEMLDQPVPQEPDEDDTSQEQAF
jgi:uncharacterized protein (DUF4415 family)